MDTQSQSLLESKHKHEFANYSAYLFMHIIINRIDYNKNEIRAIHPCQYYQNLRNTKKLKCASINKRHKPTSILKTYTH